MSNKHTITSMSNIWVIGDIAGQYDALMRLIARLPAKAKIISVGDIVDRGPKSFEVVKHFMENPQHTVVLGNHEHMMVEHITDRNYYPRDCWLMNGGGKTYESFHQNGVDLMSPVEAEPYVNWILDLPVLFVSGGLFVSHAPYAKHMKLRGIEPDNYSGYSIEESIIWNRTPPDPMPEMFQMFGHNSHVGLKTYYDDDGEPYALCTDDSRSEVLTAVHFPTLATIQEGF